MKTQANKYIWLYQKSFLADNAVFLKQLSGEV